MWPNSHNPRQLLQQITVRSGGEKSAAGRSRLVFIFVVFGSLFASGCTVVKIYNHDETRSPKIKYYPGVLFVRTSTNVSNVCIESRTFGFEKGVDGFTLGYHNSAAVIGMADNSVVIFNDKMGRTSRLVLTILTNQQGIQIK